MEEKIKEIKYYRRRHTNQAKRYGYLESGLEVDIDDDGYWMAESVRVQINEKQYSLLLAGKINLIEPYPHIEPHLYKELADSEGTPLMLGDWVRVECGTLSFDVKVHINHKYRLTPFSNYAWHRIVKLDKPPTLNKEWDTSVLRKDRQPEPWPSDITDFLKKHEKFSQIQKRIFDYYGISYNTRHY